MLFKKIIGLHHIKKHLTASADQGRIPHAQLFVGSEGSGTLITALAYAQYVLCGNTGGENHNGNQHCNLMCNGLAHPDLHFAFPIAKKDKDKNSVVSDSYLDTWRTFLKEQPYGNLFDWYRLNGVENKQGLISTSEAENISRKLSLKSYEGGYKIMLVWRADKMNTEASNKLLKLIEEPSPKTILILIAEDKEQLLPTILSRCQILQFPPLAEADIVEALKSQNVPQERAMAIAQECNGNFNKALDLLHGDSEELVFEKWFVEWVRTAFKAKGNKAAVRSLIQWAHEVAKSGRETQKKFLDYCLNIMRQAMLINYGAPELAFMKIHVDGFQLQKFAPFVHENNIEDIISEIQTAHYHIERNGNGKIILTDLSIKLTRLLHRKKE